MSNLSRVSFRENTYGSSSDSRHTGGDDLALKSMPQHERQDAPARVSATSSAAAIETSRAESTPSPDDHSDHGQHPHHGEGSAPSSSTDKKQQQTSTPPVVSSTTTTATTPPSSPRTGTRSTTMSSPDTA
eukprot:CAMPEP_0178526002 /NCGR_PEP_ID=MMETSP0696-20121128/30492_1 /TAXON_ID=265572 /ORGANISM="Extubocellulus spinifer, Strain CCMP396" /LENGTH=129 /DNA_ID=CAMNT_0020157471 /DNA_START=85 /DNA_END=471 /DNA_ORIENTATION=-